MIDSDIVWQLLEQWSYVFYSEFAVTDAWAADPYLLFRMLLCVLVELGERFSDQLAA